MPITQDRMISVISAGSTYKRHLAELRQRADQARNNLIYGKSDPLMLIYALCSDIQEAFKNEAEAAATLEAEGKYFRAMYSENARRARYNARRRAKERGLPAPAFATLRQHQQPNPTPQQSALEREIALEIERDYQDYLQPQAPAQAPAEEVEAEEEPYLSDEETEPAFESSSTPLALQDDILPDPAPATAADEEPSK